VTHARALNWALQGYAMSNLDHYPRSLEEVTRDGQLTDQDLQVLLTRPGTNERPCFEYIRPADGAFARADASTTVVLREIRDGRPVTDGIVAYADGQAEELKYRKYRK